MKYEYYMNKNNNGFIKVSLTELKNELNKVCVEYVQINEFISIEQTNLKKVEKVIRAIRKGTHYNILSDYSFSCYAKKGGDK